MGWVRPRDQRSRKEGAGQDGREDEGRRRVRFEPSLLVEMEHAWEIQPRHRSPPARANAVRVGADAYEAPGAVPATRGRGAPEWRHPGRRGQNGHAPGRARGRTPIPRVNQAGWRPTRPRWSSRSARGRRGSGTR